MNVVAWNSVTAGSGLTGGVLLDWYGVKIFPWIFAILLALGFVIAFRSGKHGFRPGPRKPGLAP